MEYKQHRSSAFDRTIFSLCTEIDELREAVEYWKERYETEARERADEWAERKKMADKQLGDTLMLAFSLQEDGSGGLVISKENRESLVEHHKTKSE